MVQLQSAASSKSSPASSLSEEEHLRHQQDVFDSISDWFADRDKEVTPELEPVYQAMAEDILSRILLQIHSNNDQDGIDASSSSDPTVIHILDVACGTGVLWEFLMEAANKAHVALVITGVDLSPSMVEHASKRAELLLQTEGNENSAHSIQIVTSDILGFCSTADPRAYDAVTLNACFGNFWDPRAVLQALPPVPVIAASHPMGASFVQQLHDQDSKTVPHTLPLSTLSMVQQWTFQTLQPMITPAYFKTKPYYLMILDKTRRAKALEQIQRYRGIVDQGYGRGGKKLGVPTANLPASLFSNALASVDTGVYFGWASLEHSPGKVFPTVVNVGYSPTFQGQENKEKIIEAHLILKKTKTKKKDNEDDDDDDAPSVVLPDFYGQVMRLQLCGFLRPEQKFDSFPDLIAQIHADIDDARTSLDSSPFVDLKKDPFLQVVEKDPKTVWVGSSGGDETASWEVVNHLETLTNMVESEQTTL